MAATRLYGSPRRPGRGAAVLLPSLYVRGQTLPSALLPRSNPLKGRRAVTPDAGGLHRMGAAPPLPRAPTPSSEPAVAPPRLLGSRAAPGPSRSPRASVGRRPEGPARSGRPFSPPREEVTWRRGGGEGEGRPFLPGAARRVEPGGPARAGRLPARAN